MKTSSTSQNVQKNDANHTCEECLEIPCGAHAALVFHTWELIDLKPTSVARAALLSPSAEQKTESEGFCNLSRSPRWEVNDPGSDPGS